ncbi:MAG: sugar phosphate isomerase/epimerase, partial [Bacteroidota bacterium]
MPVNNNDAANVSRRDFLLKGSIASMGLLIAGKSAWSKPFFFGDKPNSKYFGVQVGVITYSYRSMPGTAEQLLQYITDSGISAIELMGDAVEEYAGKPANPVKFPPFVPGQKRPELTDEQKAQLKEYEKKVAEWRSVVSMEKFEEVRKMYNKAGVSIYAFKPNALGSNNTDAEIEYALKAAKALGARSVTVELPTDAAQSKRLGDL